MIARHVVLVGITARRDHQAMAHEGVADAALAELGVQSGVRAELVVGAQAGQFQALLGGQGVAKSFECSGTGL